ncbi:MAG: DegV family protein, partial [Clostridia bacterium]|nr:DegV family protein [Clostridia bacterium]
MEYEIFADASADFSANLSVGKNIHIVSMSYDIADEQFTLTKTEGEDVFKKFYDSERKGHSVKTSQIPPYCYEEIFEPILKSGKSILYISLSGGLSNTFNSASIAAETLNSKYTAKVVCVDSLGATIGIGLILEEAVKNRSNGMNIEDNKKWIEENRLKIPHWIIVDDLMFLMRGGRIPAGLAVFGTVLNIKPILEINADGKIVSLDKKRGMRNAIRSVAERYIENTSKLEEDRVLICHADYPEGAENLAKAIRELNPKCNIE